MIISEEIFELRYFRFDGIIMYINNRKKQGFQICITYAKKFGANFVIFLKFRLLIYIKMFANSTSFVFVAFRYIVQLFANNID